MNFNPALLAKMLPSVVSELQKFLGKQNLVSTNIVETPVNFKVGAFPIDLDNMAYNLENHYGGNVMNWLSANYITPEGVDFKIQGEDFYGGYTDDFIEDMAVFFQAGGAESGRAITSAIGQKMGARLGLIRERNLHKVVSDAGLYSSVNTFDLSTTAISAWTETDIDKLLGGITELSDYMNTATGGEVWNEDMTVTDATRLHLVIPMKVWKKFKGISSKFSGLITAYGVSGTDSRFIRPEMFYDVSGGAMTTIATAFMKDPAKIDEKYKVANMVKVWDGDDIYMFTSGANPLTPSSIKEAVFKNMDMNSIDLLSNHVTQMRTRRAMVATNPYAFAKITLNGA